MIWFRNRWLSPSLKAFMEVSREILEGVYGKNDE
jgi:hypothetical protein